MGSQIAGLLCHSRIESWESKLQYKLSMSQTIFHRKRLLFAPGDSFDHWSTRQRERCRAKRQWTQSKLSGERRNRMIQKICSAVCVWMIYRWIPLKLCNLRVADPVFILNVTMNLNTVQWVMNIWLCFNLDTEESLRSRDPRKTSKDFAIG